MCMGAHLVAWCLGLAHRNGAREDAVVAICEAFVDSNMACCLESQLVAKVREGRRNSPHVDRQDVRAHPDRAVTDERGALR